MRGVWEKELKPPTAADLPAIKVNIRGISGFVFAWVALELLRDLCLRGCRGGLVGESGCYFPLIP